MVSVRVTARFHSIQSFITILTLLLCPSVSASSQEEEGGGYGWGTLVVYLDSEAGNDDLCMSPLTDTPCSSLEAIASGTMSMENLTSLEIVIHSPLVELKELVRFEGLTTVRIVGDPTQTQIQCVSSNYAQAGGNSNTGVIFVAVDNVCIEDLMFDHCGAMYNYPMSWASEYWKSFSAAVHVFNCTNILVERIIVSSSNGAGMVVSNVRGGNVSISDSLFQHNTIPVTDRQSHAGGGGIFVEVRHNLPSVFQFNNCTFVNNTQSTTDVDLYSDEFGLIIEGRGRGGGLLFRLLNIATNNTVLISRCKFIRNTAFLGGGLDIVMYDQSQNNLAIVWDSYFEENGCEPGSESWTGGGINMGYSYYRENTSHTRNNTFVLNNTGFAGNCAELGGGARFYSSHSEYPNSNNRVKFINCSWIENSGRIGTAVDISPHSDDRHLSGYLPTPEFTDCQFINNSADFKRQNLTQASGTGTLFTSLIDIKFISSVLFKYNTDSALIAFNAVANFSSCSATFENNTGVQGGAISLVGMSSMVVGPGNEYRFLHNKATDRGGAISSYLTDEHDFADSRSCFLQYTEPRVQPMEWNSTLIFRGNEAPIGKSIFTTAITACLLSSVIERLNSDINESLVLDPNDIFRWPEVFTYDDPIENQIASDGSRFDILGKLPFEIIPGEKHFLQMNIKDDLNQLVNVTLRATMDSRETTNIEIDEPFTLTEDKSIRLRGEVGDTGTLLLEFVSPRKTSIQLGIVLAPCPVGYSLNEESGECECNANSYDGLTKCNTNSLTVYIREGFWAGCFRDSLVTAVCPVGFCHYNESDESTDILLPQTSSGVELDDFICGPSRTGILCGDCAKGYTAYYHSPYYSCQKNNLCSIGWVVYISTELVPATVLFVVILVFEVKFLSGQLNGFILFSQLLSTLFIDTMDVIAVPDTVHFLSWGYRIIYGFFSLDFFTIEPLSFCLWEGATVLDVLAFKYVTIAYSLILIILVIIFMRHFASRLFGGCLKISPIQTSVVHGLSAFLVVCYTQCIKVSLMILLSRSLQGEGDKVMTSKRVLFSGGMEMFSPGHLPYAIPALICLLTLGMIPPVLLLAHPLSYQVAKLCKINDETHPKLCGLYSNVDLKLKPIFDSFQGCFKDSRRCFAGIYFLYRWVGLIAYAISPRLSLFYAILQVMLTVMLLIHAVAHPYESKWHNLVDALLLTDLTLINVITGFNYYYTRVMAQEVQDQRIIDITTSLQLVLIYLPIIAMLVFLMVKAHQKLCFHGNTANNAPNEHKGEHEHEDIPARLLDGDNDDDQQTERERNPLLRSGMPYIFPPYGPPL